MKSLASPETKVVRKCTGKKCADIKIKAKEVVPGDIIVLEAGDKVPADARVIQAVNLEIDESMLTGESTPTTKNIQPLPPEKQVAD